jgi:hypothetical protein
MLTRETLIQLAMSRCHAHSESMGRPQWAQGDDSSGVTSSWYDSEHHDIEMLTRENLIQLAMSW